jgi:hypothetical protein
MGFEENTMKILAVTCLAVAVAMIGGVTVTPISEPTTAASQPSATRPAPKQPLTPTVQSAVAKVKAIATAADREEQAKAITNTLVGVRVGGQVIVDSVTTVGEVTNITGHLEWKANPIFSEKEAREIQAAKTQAEKSNAFYQKNVGFGTRGIPADTEKAKRGTERNAAKYRDVSEKHTAAANARIPTQTVCITTKAPSAAKLKTGATFVVDGIITGATAKVVSPPEIKPECFAALLVQIDATK